MNIVVRTSAMTATTGRLEAGGTEYPCTLGRAGVTSAKREGDGATPLGTFPLREVLWRADRVPKPETSLPLRPLLADDGWCEDPAHPDYNRAVKLPHPSVHDRMTRDDALYDIVIVVGYNDSPPVAGKGSAIFIHLARPDFTPTAGCIGLRAGDILNILKLCDSSSTVAILPPGS